MEAHCWELFSLPPQSQLILSARAKTQFLS